MVSRIAVAIPSHEHWQAEFGVSLARLMGYEGSARLRQIALMNRRGGSIQEARQVLAEEALKLKCDGVLWLDSDMVFPPTALERLVGHYRPIVGCDYPKRVGPPVLVGKALDGSQIDMRTDKELVQAAGLGFGCLYTAIQVFTKMARPWFDMPWNEELGRPVGEDLFFCRKAADAGVRIYCDIQLSKQIAHMGSSAVTVGDTLSVV